MSDEAVEPPTPGKFEESYAETDNEKVNAVTMAGGLLVMFALFAFLGGPAFHIAGSAMAGIGTIASIAALVESARHDQPMNFRVGLTAGIVGALTLLGHLLLMQNGI